MLFRDTLYEKHFFLKNKGVWPCGTMGRLQILRDGFDSRMKPIVFDIAHMPGGSKSTSSLGIVTFDELKE